MQEYRKGLIYVKKRSLAEMMTYFIFLFPFIMALLLEFIGIPSFIKYTVDLVYVCALLLVTIRKYAVLNKKLTPFVIFTVGYLLYCFIVHLFNLQSPFYFLWGVRNNFRFYIAFLLFALIFDEDDANGCLKFMDILFWVNAVVSFFQFFVLDYRQDHLGGIFGTEKGCNAFTIFFFSIVIGKSILRFMNKEENTLLCFIKCGISLLLAAMAELKFYFILFIMILVLSSFLTRFSFRKVVLISVAAVFVMLSSMLLSEIFGDSRTLSIENLWETITAKNYATSKDLGRFTAIPTISRDILTNTFSRLFGMGLGNCDTSSFDICNTPFYQSHSYLNYVWFSSAFLFLETGFLGLVAYILFFVLCFVLARGRLKNNCANELFCQISMIMSLICIVMVFYNSSLRTEIAYMAFFALALPFMKSKETHDF